VYDTFSVLQQPDDYCTSTGRRARRGSLGVLRHPATGNFSDAKVIRKFGDVPDDLSA
jgi:hypothetical protein